jgi:uncharacterized protein YvpB
MRRALGLATAVALLAAACGGGGATPRSAASGAAAEPAPHALIVHAGPVALTMLAERRTAIETAPGSSRKLLERWVQRHATVVHGRGWSIHLRWTGAGVAAVLRAVRSPVNDVRAPVSVRSTRLTLPAVHQVYRDGCEAAALSMMLRVRVGQRRLQAMLPIAQPVQQEVENGAATWGDPELGFVGNVAGGGYGVYDRPLLALARRFDSGTTNLTGAPLESILDALRHGRPIVAWIALGASDPVTWRALSGRLVRANWAEHAITLTGYGDGVITYNNPWDGGRERFTLGQFAAVWRDLGDRAIAGSSLITPVA